MADEGIDNFTFEENLEEVRKELQYNFKEREKMCDRCWYCGGKLIWNSDFNYSDVYGTSLSVLRVLPPNGYMQVISQ